MKSLFDKLSFECSRTTTKTYSTSFSLGILFLDKDFRDPIYSIYGFVRFADEIVDSFHGYNKEDLLSRFRKETYAAIREKISLNPILNSFQSVVHRYSIGLHWVDQFLDSMEMDLHGQTYTEDKYRQYILGSAESVGLMCLHVFTDGNTAMFEDLKPFAMRLGAAFQKVNFLRDAQADNLWLGRTYFPNIDLASFSLEEKRRIEHDIETDFAIALKGIRLLPKNSRNGVYLAYYYYLKLFKKIKRLPPERVLSARIRIPNAEKLLLMFKSNLKYQLNII